MSLAELQRYPVISEEAGRLLYYFSLRLLSDKQNQSNHRSSVMMCLISHHHVSTSVSEYSLQNWMHTLNSVFSQIMCVWFSTGQSQ